MNTRRNVRKAERGQVLIMCAVSMFVLLLFVGFAIDFGVAYVTKAQLAKASDAASLTAARYSGMGPTAATTLAQSAFAMNYGPSSLDYTSAPVVTVAYSTDSSGNTLVNTTVNTTTKTFFAGLLPGFSTLNVAASSQSMARRVQMTLLLDRTGSMNPVGVGSGEDGGSLYLPGAVADFINLFNNTSDSVALVSFANNQTVDVPMMTGGFQQPIINAANAMVFSGGTFTDGGLQRALATENAFTPPPGTNPTKVVVFFTDGNANTVEGPLTCNGGGNVQSGTWNFGGTDTVNTTLFLTTSNTYYQNNNACPSAYPLTNNPSSVCFSQQDTGTNACSYNGQTSTFTALSGAAETISWANVTADARNRSISDANTMRNLGITVYAVGLGGAFTPVDQTFLCEVANASCSPTYNSALLPGAMQYAATADQLDEAFQEIAGVIRLRLTQ